MTKINDGDIFDIGQTVNGCSKFIWLGKWFYFHVEQLDPIGKEYEYDQDDLTKTILNENEEYDISFYSNIFNYGKY